MKKRNRRRDAAKERRWRELVARQRRSKLSIRAFCAEQQVSENSFYAWRRELALRDAEASIEPHGFQRQRDLPAGDRRQRPSPQSETDPASPFLPVTLANLSAGIEIDLPSGVTLRVAADCDEGALRRVFSALEVLSC